MLPLTIYSNISNKLVVPIKKWNLQNLVVDKTKSMYVCEAMHNVLHCKDEGSRKRVVDGVYQLAVN